MTATTPEQRISVLLHDAISLEAELAHFEWNKQLYEQQHPNAVPPPSMQERDYELRTPFAEKLHALYLESVILIQSKGLPDYLKQFYDRFGSTFDEWKAANEFGDDENYSPGPYSSCLRDFRKYLSPFNVVATSYTQYERQAGIVYLERLLRNTAALLEWRGIKPTGEPEIYHAVRDVLQLIFPKARNAPAAQFNKVFKTYKPDVLIPDLAVAVEYKYIDSQEKVKTVIEEIAVDVKAYTADLDYDLFYAVFFFTSNFCSAERFEESWLEFSFPASWKPIYVVRSAM